ncbi:hypothetical protein [Streptomyces albus]|uniref:hypothetical protein n=1 Tax=Streptomyces albus TaxID=1888 RepID=UPI003F1C584B
MGEEDGGSHLCEGIGGPVRIGGEQGFAVAVFAGGAAQAAEERRAGPGALCGRAVEVVRPRVANSRVGTTMARSIHFRHS